MKKLLAIAIALVLSLTVLPVLADEGPQVLSDAPQVLPQSGYTSTLLASLTHNCTNTGVMLPTYFDPYQTTYLLTVASWVSRPTFTPVAYDPSAVITVNGKRVYSGQTSDPIPMTDKPQAVQIVVSNGGASTTYTVFLQRRPSERRTRVSAGYINNITQKGTTWYIDADLVTISYAGDNYNSGNLSTFNNGTKEVGVYNYEVDVHCSLYYGTLYNPVRATNIETFANHYWENGNTMYKFVYIEDKIVAVFPYGADY